MFKNSVMEKINYLNLNSVLNENLVTPSHRITLEIYLFTYITIIVCCAKCILILLYNYNIFIFIDIEVPYNLRSPNNDELIQINKDNDMVRNETTLHKTIIPLLIVAKIFGLFPVKNICGQNGSYMV